MASGSKIFQFQYAFSLRFEPLKRIWNAIFCKKHNLRRKFHFWFRSMICKMRVIERSSWTICYIATLLKCTKSVFYEYEYVATQIILTWMTKVFLDPYKHQELLTSPSRKYCYIRHCLKNTVFIVRWILISLPFCSFLAVRKMLFSQNSTWNFLLIISFDYESSSLNTDSSSKVKICLVFSLFIHVSCKEWFSVKLPKYRLAV